MKKFKFGLGKILGFKNYKKKEQEMLFAKIVQAINVSNTFIEKNKKEYDRVFSLHTDVNLMIIKERRAKIIKKKIDEETQNLVQLHKDMEKKRLDFLEASKEVKALQSLKQRKKKLYRQNMAKKEAMSLDDITQNIILMNK